MKYKALPLLYLNLLIIFVILLTPVKQIWATPLCQTSLVRQQGSCGFCWLYASADSLNSFSRNATEDFSANYPIAADIVEQINWLVALPDPNISTFSSPFLKDGVNLFRDHGSLPNAFWPYKKIDARTVRTIENYFKAYQAVFDVRTGEKERFLNAIVDLLKEHVPLEIVNKSRLRIVSTALHGLNPKQNIYNSNIISIDYFVAMHLIRESMWVLDDLKQKTDLHEGGWFEWADTLLESGGAVPFWAYRLKKVLTSQDITNIRQRVFEIASEHHRQRELHGPSMERIAQSQEKIMAFLLEHYINPLPTTFVIHGVSKTPKQWYAEILNDHVPVSLRTPKVGEMLDITNSKAKLSDVRLAITNGNRQGSRHTLKVTSYAFSNLVKEVIDSGKTVWVAMAGWEPGKTVNIETGEVTLPQAERPDLANNFHAVLVTDYETDNGRRDGNITGFIYKNSHGLGFGTNGGGIIRSRYFEQTVRSVVLWIKK